MISKETLYKNALRAIEDIYEQSKYDKDVDLYRSFDIMNFVNDSQMQSKEWLVDTLSQYFDKKYLKEPLRDVLIMGSWYGMTSILLRKYVDLEVKIWNIDSDPLCEKYGNMLKQDLEGCEHNWFRTDDALEYYFDRTGAFQLIINTSCEHMEPEDLKLILSMKPLDTMVCFQSNNMKSEAEHINTHNSINEFVESLNLARVFFADTFKYHDYERYMVIGV